MGGGRTSGSCLIWTWTWTWSSSCVTAYVWAGEATPPMGMNCRCCTEHDLLSLILGPCCSPQHTPLPVTLPSYSQHGLPLAFLARHMSTPAHIRSTSTSLYTSEVHFPSPTRKRPRCFLVASADVRESFSTFTRIPSRNIRVPSFPLSCTLHVHPMTMTTMHTLPSTRTFSQDSKSLHSLGTSRAPPPTIRTTELGGPDELSSALLPSWCRRIRAR